METNAWNVFGQNWAVEMLLQNVRQGRLSHAYLLTGPEGVGRRTLALRLTQALNCPSPAAPGVPCGVCRTCKQIEAEKFIDLMVIRKPLEKTEIVVDQIRELNQYLSLKPYASTHKVVLIVDFGVSNDNAQNALLKMLEEAPSYALILMTVEAVEQLLPTILSRCEVLRLRPAPVEQVDEYLSSCGLEQDASRLFARISGGCAGLALRLSRDGEAQAFRRQKLEDLRSLLPMKRYQRFGYAEDLVKENDKYKKKEALKGNKLIRDTLLIWLSFWRDVLLQSSGSAAPLTNVDYAETIETLAFSLERPAVRERVTELVRALDRLEKNVNLRLLLEVTLMDWPRLQP